MKKKKRKINDEHRNISDTEIERLNTDSILQALVVFQMPLKVFSHPKGSGTTDVLTRELSKLGVLR